MRLESLPLAELAEGLDGRPAWVVSHRALTRALAGASLVPVAALGSRELLALAAGAGCWARAVSPHELRVARGAGFPPERIVVDASLPEDGLLRDALGEGVAVLRAEGEAAAQAARIAAALGHGLPPTTGAPPALADSTLWRIGGLLARALAGAPDVVLDAPWSPRGRARVTLAPVAGLPGGRLPGGGDPNLGAEDGGELLRASVRGLAGDAAPARLAGPVARGDWVVVPDRRAAQARAPDLAWPMPLGVLVREGGWRTLEERPLPSDGPR